MKKKFLITLAVFCAILLATSVQSCYYDNEEYLYGNGSSATCDTASVKYATVIKPLMDVQCATAGCHNASAASAGANLSTHTATKLYITNGKDFFLGSIRHTSGFSAMPKGGSKMAACDIKKIEAWVASGMPNN